MKPESAPGASWRQGRDVTLYWNGKAGLAGAGGLERTSNLWFQRPALWPLSYAPAGEGQWLPEDPGSGKYTFMGCPGQRGNVSSLGCTKNARLSNTRVV